MSSVCTLRYKTELCKQYEGESHMCTIESISTKLVVINDKRAPDVR